MIKNVNKKRSLFLKALKKDKDLKQYKGGIKAIEELPLNSFKKDKEYSCEHFEIKNLIITDDNAFEIFEDKLKYIASNEIKLIDESNVKYWTCQVNSIINNNS